MKKRNNFKWRIWSLLLVMFSVSQITALNAACEPVYEVKLENQQLSIQAIQAPLEVILAQVSQKSGIEIFFQGDPEDVMTIQMGPVALEMGLKQLLRGHNHAFIYGSKPDRTIVLKQLHIYSATGRGKLVRALPDADVTPKETGIVLAPEIPSDRDPLVTMQAIDPLMKINQVNAHYLPENFHTENNDRFGTP